MKIRGVAATLQHLRVYEIREYEAYLTRSGQYKWRRARSSKMDGTMLVSKGADLYEVSQKPLLIFEDGQTVQVAPVGKNTQRVASKQFNPYTGSVTIQPVMTIGNFVYKSRYKGTDGVTYHRGKLHNSLLSEEELASLSEHEKALIQIRFLEEQKKSTESRNHKRREKRKHSKLTKKI